MKPNLFLFAIISVFFFACKKPAIQQKIDLAGQWKFAIDSLDRGVSESWFNQDLTDRITLPGSMTTNGKGNDIGLKTPWTGQIMDSAFFKNPEYAKYRQAGNFKVPFWLQPVKYYKGAAWYQKEVVIPDDWKDRSVELFLERCHWESRVWVDGTEAGMQNSLGTPHRYQLGKLLTPGKHRISVCIDNRIKAVNIGDNSHSITDHTQSNWNGMIGQLYLEARPMTYIANIQVFPDVHAKTISVKVLMQNQSQKAVSGKLNLKIQENGKSKTENVELKPGENILETTLEMGADAKLWNEFHPDLYSLTAELTAANGQAELRQTSFGMREIKTSGRHILVNGNPVFLRGTLECAIFPKTGFPPTDTTAWMRIFRVCRAHGLNHLRFHSWCPPEAAFVAADHSGFYLHVECSSWAWDGIGSGGPLDRYLMEESERMTATYGNHPSFCMMAYGNEPGGKNHVTYLEGFVKHWKGKDSRRIYTTAAGWPNIDANDYQSTPSPRIQGWGEELKSIINAQPPRSDYDWSAKIVHLKQPVVSHEIGQWCVYPNFREMTKYDGVLKPRNFEIFQESLNDHGMAQLADSFLLASGKLQALCYKADIEAALRTKDFGGFQLLDLHDFPGQGTALVGVLDPFWGKKGYVSPAEYKRFCNSTVPLARLKKMIFTTNETFEAAIELAHYGDAPLKACTPEWKITDRSGKLIQSGKFAQTDVPLGNGFKLGDISWPLSAVAAPEKLMLEVTVNGLSNSWDFWVYPAIQEKISGEEKIKVVQKLDASTAQFLNNGGTVLLNLKQGTLAKALGGEVKIGFSSIFWNTAWTHGQAPNTLGVLVNPNHPALAAFPTEYHSNYQWWDAMSHSNAIEYSKLSPEIQPIVRVIDDWFTNRPLALVFEAKVGKGKIVVSGIDLTTDLDKRPEARQMLFSLKKYMAGAKFNPKQELETEQLKKL